MNGKEHKTEIRTISGLRETTLELRISEADAILLWDLLAILPAKLKTDEARKEAKGLFDRYRAELRRVLHIDENTCCYPFTTQFAKEEKKIDAEKEKKEDGEDGDEQND